MKIFVDTNVILDFFLARRAQKKAITELFEQIYKERIEAFTSASCITDIYYITAKRLGYIRARDVLIDLLRILGIVAVDGNDCVKALNLPIVDYEDSLVLTCASKAGISYIVSNDKDFLSVRTPLVQHGSIVALHYSD